MSKLFYDDEHEALQLMVSNSGKTIKEVAHFLWPDMKSDSAYAKLKACLNPKGDEQFKFGHVIALMKFCNSYEPLEYMCDETMHARPPRKAPEDDVVTIAEIIQGAADTMTKAMGQLERLQGQTLSMRTVKRAA